MQSARKCILGISGYYHDSAAAIVVDGELVAAAQEERFTRRKHDHHFPTQAIRYCLDKAQVSLSELDAVVFYDKPILKFDRLLESYLSTVPYGFRSFATSMPIWLKEKLLLKSVLRRELCSLLNKEQSLPKLLFTEHHQSHAASAFYPSPFQDSAVLCLDGVGEWTTTSGWFGSGKDITLLWEQKFPHSLGLLYSAFTYFCGFRVNSGEYKLMGLAPYGSPKYVSEILDNLLDLKPDGSFRLNMRYFDFITGLRMTNSRFEEIFKFKRRLPESAIDQKYMDVASSIQAVTEDIVLRFARTMRNETGSDNLCLAGGVALNCVANGKLSTARVFDRIWVQPAAGDAGGAVGAAFAGWHEYFGQQRQTKDLSFRDQMSGSFLGPEYSCSQTESDLNKFSANYQRVGDEELFIEVSKSLSDGMVVGWFQGRMEFGPRALGNRSILADPRSPKMQSLVNLKIKYRESFRPFAPAVLFEDRKKYFEIEESSPYMLFVHNVQQNIRLKPSESNTVAGISRVNEVRSTIPAVTHVDYSARIQTVHRETNPRFYKLIETFKALTGCSVLINTSFNVRGEPLVCRPSDAYRCFMRTEMDVLVIGNYILRKQDQPKFEDRADWQNEFELD